MYPMQELCPEFACNEWYCATCCLAAVSWISCQHTAFCHCYTESFFRNISGGWHAKHRQWLNAVLMMLMLLVFPEVNAHVRLDQRSDQMINLLELSLIIGYCGSVLNSDWALTPQNNIKKAQHVFHIWCNYKYNGTKNRKEKKMHFLICVFLYCFLFWHMKNMKRKVK